MPGWNLGEAALLEARSITGLQHSGVPPHRCEEDITLLTLGLLSQPVSGFYDIILIYTCGKASLSQCVLLVLGFVY